MMLPTSGRSWTNAPWGLQSDSILLVDATEVHQNPGATVEMQDEMDRLQTGIQNTKQVHQSEGQVRKFSSKPLSRDRLGTQLLPFCKKVLCLRFSIRISQLDDIFWSIRRVAHPSPGVWLIWQTFPEVVTESGVTLNVKREMSFQSYSALNEVITWALCVEGKSVFEMVRLSTVTIHKKQEWNMHHIFTSGETVKKHQEDSWLGCLWRQRFRLYGRRWMGEGCPRSSSFA